MGTTQYLTGVLWMQYFNGKTISYFNKNVILNLKINSIYQLLSTNIMVIRKHLVEW